MINISKIDKVSKNDYRLPIPSNNLKFIDRKSSPAHIGKLQHSVDFIAPIGTPVLAAAEGIVTFTKDDSIEGGPFITYWNSSNFLVIKHANDEYTRYDHLAYKSIKVKTGEYVNLGQQIAEVGMTGYTFIPHLHFQAFVFTGPDIFNDFETIEVKDFKY